MVKKAEKTAEYNSSHIEVQGGLEGIKTGLTNAIYQRTKS